ncbi:MAG: cryptochrome/photolyase family protein [Bacteriovoracaceae bacterium]|jgi:deoxyribodipyrimidine photolyase-related protein|nr:cryptochrome/photolyase family protein [Halobacteriovoraceae bacterium]MDP7320766.1 cryptochrome/photolyase family protein [Bacteriovoracaceae bacterium]
MILQVILGNQLFPLKYYDVSKPIFMCEDYQLCTHFKYHKHKIIFFLASMRNYRDLLKSKEFSVSYFELEKEASFFDNLERVIDENNIDEVLTYEIEDKFFETKMEKFCQDRAITIKFKKSPMFLVSRAVFKEYNLNAKKPFMKNFYESLRKSTKVLMDKDNQPLGGQFSFDKENRKKIPKKFDVIKNSFVLKHDRNTKEVIKVVEKFFCHHPGETENFWLQVNRKGALKELKKFLNSKLELFGPYEDAIDNRDPFLYHSTLSCYLNIGLLTPYEVIQQVLKKDVSLNSKEGFVRQVMGWREFVRGIYQEYSEEQEKRNFFNHQRKLSQAWYKGTTQIKPLDDVICKVNQYGYSHHIERLMIVSNMMLLCEIHPFEVYRWFMEMYADSSDWVMGPNVYGMGQFSDGGIFATKPYIASSNYILKMSHYKKDGWCHIVDGLYWRFINKHREFFKTNYRMSMMVNIFDKMDDQRKKEILGLAEDFIENYTLTV